MEKPGGFSFLRRGIGAPEGAPKRSEATSEISRMGHDEFKNILRINQGCFYFVLINFSIRSTLPRSRYPPHRWLLSLWQFDIL